MVANTHVMQSKHPNISKKKKKKSLDYYQENGSSIGVLKNIL